MPTIRLGFLPLLLCALSLSACASLSVEQQVEQMEDRQAEYRLLDDLRFALLEKRLGNLETAVEAVRNQLAGIPPRQRSARAVAPAARVVAPPERPAPLTVSKATPRAVPDAGEIAPEAAKAAPASPTPAPPAMTKSAPAITPTPMAGASPADSPAATAAPVRSPVSVSVAHAAPPPPAKPEALRPTEVVTPNASRPAETGKAEASRQAPAETSPAPSAPKSAPSRTALTPPDRAARAAYDAALALYYKGQYTQSEEAFDDFLERHPGTRLTPNALYWQGECFYSQGKFDTAIMSFKDVAGKFPKHDKAAASLLKAGYAYAELNDMENARFYWRILLDDFPGSTPAKLARRRLEGR
jgi:tol-pal system protein YbgF